ncbi:ATP-binding protein [Mangrovimonas sp. ST2L15]|uniref:ATP-binding protein n=1 Tax=Mangrovimonas sp. ST2L15 TaxID=1645916 RepID=UPI0006B4289F|nr:ATP-binding protein [Mangrovimonas sp. ST2L15]
MLNKLTAYPKRVDLDNCEDEPIQFIGQVQNHGFLLVIDSQRNILQCSANIKSFLGIEAETILESTFNKFLSRESYDKYLNWESDGVDHIPFIVNFGDKEFVCIPHRQDELILLDFEKVNEDWNPEEFQQSMISVFRKLSSTQSLNELCDKAANLIKELLEYDRVMIYQFDEKWNGTVIAESREDHLESWLGLHYPAGDIPANARRLFLEQGVRILSNIREQYAPLVPSLNPLTQALVNMGKSHLRGSSAIHIEYLENMKVEATLNCAIVHNGILWGLISCHHYNSKFIDYRKRQSCSLLAEMFSTQISQKLSNTYLARINQSSFVRAKITENVSKNWDIIEGLTVFDTNATNLFKCDGFCIAYNEEIVILGETPAKKDIIPLLNTLHDKSLFNEGCYATDSLMNVINWTEEQAEIVSGLLVCKLSKRVDEALLWFRSEQINEVSWGGDPKSHQHADKSVRLSPRKSFEKWTEKVRYTSQPWKDYEISTALALTNDIKNVIVTKFGEISQLNNKLYNLNQELESFSYSVSHDLRGPLRSIDGFAQILLEDYGEVLDKYGKDTLNTIIGSAEKMNRLMDEILSYSSLNQLRLQIREIDVIELCDEIIQDFGLLKEFPSTEFSIQENIPKIKGDRTMMYQLFSNLLTNAFKYSVKSNPPKIQISQYVADNHHIFQVKDNGIGFNPKYKEKIFGIFNRLSKEDFKGTGVGLAIAQRVVIKHHGEIWADSEEGKGSTFSFYLEED